MGASCKSFCHASVQGPGFRTYFQYLSPVHRLLATRLIGTASHRSHQRQKDTFLCSASPNYTSVDGVAPRPCFYLIASSPPPPVRHLPAPPTLTLLAGLVLIQALALVGAVTGGVLARKRRLELEGLNAQLRHINSKLRRRRKEDAAAALSPAASPAPLSALRSSLELSLAAPAAAHPTEAYGTDNLSLAQARKTIGACARQARECLSNSNPLRALELVRQAEQVSDEVSDLRATRALLRLKARVFRELGDLRGALAALQSSMEISKQLQEPSGDADTLGEIADVYVEMGDVETAAQYYDMCITAIEDETMPSLSSTWDL